MKKFVFLTAVLCLGMFAVAPVEMQAQKKARTAKTTTARKSAASSKKPAASAKSVSTPAKPARESYIKLLPGADLTSENIFTQGHPEYFGFVDGGLGGGLLLFADFYLSSDYGSSFMVGSGWDKATWSLSDNKISIGDKFSLTSPDKGQVLTGTYTNGKGVKSNMIAYNFGDEEVVPSAQRKILKSLTEKKILGAYIVMSARGMKLAFPVDFEMNDDLTWEVTSDNETMGVFGELKGKFRVGQNGTDVYVNGNGSSGTIHLKSLACGLGEYNVPGFGRVDSDLYVFF